jgi:two-component system phosphate regulon response regulator PhoB
VARVLIIDDEPELQERLEYTLAQAGHLPFTASTGATGLQAAREMQPEVVLLDLMLPDMPGTRVARELRRDAKTRGIPIIMMTAKADEIDRVAGFEIGADDFVVKPFEIHELLLRIEAVLRRSSWPPNPQILDVGELHVDCQAHRVTVNEEDISLAALEFKLLVTLIERHDHVMPRATLLSDVWGVNPEITTRTVDTHVKRLRGKLGSAGRFIQTVRGIGYRFSENPPRDR